MLLQSTIVLLLVPLGVQGSKKFLTDDLPFHGAFQQSLMPICGGEANPEKLAALRKTIEPMWKTLPKMLSQNIDRQSFRYLSYRYFMQTSKLMVKGFEPNRLTNETQWGVADILSIVAPGLVTLIFDSDRAKHSGFSLTETINLVGAMEQLILDSETSLLRKVYRMAGASKESVFSHKELNEILDNYMIEWIVEGDEADMASLLGNKSLVASVLPHYDDLIDFTNGRIRAFQYARVHHITAKSQHRHTRISNTWNDKYTFEDAAEIAGSITQTFHSFWQSECEHMKDKLATMDPHHTGRVPLSLLYNQAIEADWRFGESEAYLRELGALDDSSSQLGTQVIIPNYIQSTSNCIVSTPYYAACCQNDCELIMGDIEDQVHTSTASVESILDIVSNLTVHTSIDHEYSPTLAGALTEHLEDIAKGAPGGLIPLHGRLFAQWLHYAFPRDCPFPHKSGLVSPMSPMQFGDESLASNDEMLKHAQNTTSADFIGNASKADLDWMSQWDNEEELILDYSGERSIPRQLIGVVSLVLLAVGLRSGTVRLGTKNNLHVSERKAMV